MRKRVAVIGTMGLPAKYGGFETFTHFLVDHLAKDYDFTVYCSGPDYQDRPDSVLGARLVYLPLRANGPQSLLFDWLGTIHACFSADVLLVLGSSGGMFFPLARLLGRKVILNQGGLDWQRSKWGARTRKLLKFLERSSVLGADVLVSDNEGIGDYFRTAYGRESHLIEYGGDQITRPSLSEAFLDRYPMARHPFAFAVARIQPDNNIEMILEGFLGAQGYPLVFVGNWDNSAFGRELKERYEDTPNLHLLEAIYDPDTLNQFRCYCSIYIHGHSAGGTNPSLVEAMHLGLPIASFDVTYNRATTEDRCLYFRTSSELAGLLQSTPIETWESQRPALLEIANRRYCWHQIAEKYARLF